MFRKIIGTGALSKRIGKASFWTTMTFGSTNGLRLISNLFLTRLLTPEIFGIMALAQVFMSGVTMLSDVGVRSSVVRSQRGEDETFLRAAWTVQIIRSTFIALVCCAIAWPISIAYDAPILFPLICVLSISAFMSGFRSISIALANRNLLMKNLFWLTLSTRVITILITVFAAWKLQSVWALAIGVCFGAVIEVVLSHVIMPKFRHRLSFEKAALLEIFRFGRWILLATFFGFLGTKGQQAMFGFVVPIELIGIIAIAVLLAEIPNELLKKIINTVLFPSFAQIVRERPKDLPKALRKVRLFTICVAFPISFSVSLLAQPIVDLMYDDRYASAGVILTFLALNGTIPILSTTYQQILLAEGRSDLQAMLMFVWASLTTLGIFVGFSLYGLIGSLVGIAIGTSIMFFINTSIARRRGYSTGVLDALAYGIVFVAYCLTLWLVPVPDAFWSPDLIQSTF